MRAAKFLCPFLMGMAGMSLLFVGQMKARDLGAPDVWLGIQATACLLMYVVGNFVVGRAMRIVPRRALLAGGPIMCLGASVLVFLIGDYRFLPLATGLQGFGASLFWAPIEVTIAEQAHSSRLKKELGAFNISWTLALVVGPSLTGVLYDRWQETPFFLVFASYACAAAILAGVRFAPLAGRAGRPEDVSGGKEGGVEPRVARAHLVLVWIAIVAQGFASFALFAFFHKVTKIHGFPDSIPGLMIGVRALALLLTCIALSRTSRWQYRLSFLFGVQIASAGAVLVIAFFPAHILLLIPAFSVMGACYGFCYNASLFYTMSDTRVREVHSARHELLVGAGPVFGPLVVGLVTWKSGSYAIGFSTCAVAIAVAVMIQLKVLRMRAKTVWDETSAVADRTAGV